MQTQRGLKAGLSAPLAAIVIALAKLFTDAAEGRLEDTLAAKVNAWLPSNLREVAQTDDTERDTGQASAA